MGRRSNAEAWRGTLSARRLWGFDSPAKGANFRVSGLFDIRRAALAVLLACLDDLPLPLSHVQASLQLLTHGGVLGVEARGKTGEAHVLHMTAPWARRARREGARGMDNVVVRQVESLWAVSSGGGHVGRGRLLLDNDLGAARRKR